MLPLALGGRGLPIASVLCLGAHCDDIEIGCGGTLAWLRQQHPDIAFHWHVFGATDQRAAETRQAAERLVGKRPADSLTIDRFRDGYFPYVGGDIKDRFEELKGDHAPDVIFTHYRGDAHQDHRVISELTRNTFRNHLVLEYEIPKYDGDLGNPNLYVPLDKATCKHKVDAIVECHQSQHARAWFTADAFYSLMRLRGVECHAPSGHAEAFYCTKAVLG